MSTINLYLLLVIIWLWGMGGWYFVIQNINKFPVRMSNKGAVPLYFICWPFVCSYSIYLTHRMKKKR